MMLTSTRERGAVNIILFVIVLVIAIAGWVLWYTAFKEAEENAAATVSANASLKQAQDKVLAYDLATKELTDVLGVPPMDQPADDQLPTDYVEAVAVPRAQQVRGLIDSARALFRGDDSMNKVVNILDPAQAMIEKLEADIARLGRELESARADVASAQQANDALITAHGSVLDERNTELADAKTRAAEQLSKANQQFETTLAQLNTLQRTFDEKTAEMREEVNVADRQVNENNRNIARIRARLTAARREQLIDGRVIEVDRKIGTCYINIGSRDHVRLGMRFSTHSLNKGQVREEHGFIVVTKIESERSLCKLEPSATTQAGDFIQNPYYDAEDPAYFVFLGSLPGRYDNQQATAIIRDFGGVVQDQLTIDTDFVVLGKNPDPDAALDEEADPNWFMSTETYTNAIKWGVQFLRARDLEEFLRY